ncbi:MAG TPA: DUF3105 domain-containing protein [Propionibacteriaceae bacterium]|nr:DUF3105 domain-containing protein [Propionibacteriaceae bacterium]
MASSKTKAEPATGSRRDRLASFEAARKKDQRRRTLTLFAICSVLALALLAYPLYLFVNDARLSRRTISEIGVSAAAAGCDPVAKNAATGNQDHVAEGTEIPYPQSPPDSGPHYATPAGFTKRFYNAEDRPAVGTLVHNLEHGYTIAWYRDSMPADQITELERISKTFKDEGYRPENKFIAAPWSESDGPGFPAGKNVVLAHWYADPDAPTDVAKQQGVRQACNVVSGAVVADFMKQYPYQASPEPNAQ